MWVLWASLNPMSEAFRSMFAKKASQHVDPIIISWFNNIFPTLVFAPILFFIDFQNSTEFWIGLAGSGLINIGATIIYMRALSEGDISAVMPMLSFTPLFLLVTGPIIVGEIPHTQGIVGILFVVTGSYLLNINFKERDLLGPFKSLLKNKGTRYMMIVSFLWSISAPFDKLAVNNASIYQYMASLNLFIFVGLNTVVFSTGKFNRKQFIKARKNLFIVSSFTVGSFIFHMTALSMTYVAYVVAMKRMSGVISVILGAVFLKEANFRNRIVGAIVMFAGVILIVTS